MANITGNDYIHHKHLTHGLYPWITDTLTVRFSLNEFLPLFQVKFILLLWKAKITYPQGLKFYFFYKGDTPEDKNHICVSLVEFSSVEKQ